MCKFRAVTENDFEDICKLIHSREALFLVYPNGKYPLTVNQLKELGKTRKELTVAMDGNKIIGFANLYNCEPGGSAFIGNVIIEKNYRGRGIGEKLISHMQKTAFHVYNFQELKISVFNKNVQALLLYAKLGFIPYGIEERTDPKGNRVALIHMNLQHQSI
ncbi:MAG TPA: GNAT family N-acetyltransferase [Gammaproteobacteria bacterium]|nr:GNAT family N-acetyltransferase [Gammaproteobacteria bacterium]